MNALKMIYTLKILLPPFDFSNPPFSLSIQGDDSLVLIKPEFLSFVTPERVQQISATLGFHVKFVKITTDVCEVDYCSRYFWPTDDNLLGYLPGPKIGKVLNKIGYSKIPIDNVYAHARSVALGLFKDVNHIPFLREWVATILRVTHSTQATAVYSPYKIFSEEAVFENSKTWDHLFQRYGLTMNDLSTFISDLEQVDRLPYYVDFPVPLESLLKIDNS